MIKRARIMGDVPKTHREIYEVYRTHEHIYLFTPNKPFKPEAIICWEPKDAAVHSVLVDGQENLINSVPADMFTTQLDFELIRSNLNIYCALSRMGIMPITLPSISSGKRIQIKTSGVINKLAIIGIELL